MRKICLLLAMLVWPLLLTKGDYTNVEMIPYTESYVADTIQMLDIYKKLTGLELDVASEVISNNSNVKFFVPSVDMRSVKKEDFIKLCEQLLTDKAHVTITKIDAQHAKVTLKENPKAVEPARTNETQSVIIQSGLIHFQDAEMPVVLDIYHKLTGLELDVAHNVLIGSPAISLHLQNAAKEEVIKKLEAALLEQAKVVVTKIDDKHAKVTFKGQEASTPDHH